MFSVESAGFEPGGINPLATKILKIDEDIDISDKQSDSLFEFFKEGKLFNYVITLCDEASAQRCPIFPGVRARIQWSFEDPRTFTGTEEEKIAKIRVVKDEIKKEILDFIELVKSDKLKENFPENWKLG
jgi:arsenate reductase